MIEDQVTFTHAKLADLAGVSPRRLRYWNETDLVHPHTAQSSRGRGTVRLYGYREALTVLVLAELRESISLHQIRAIVDHLRQREFEVSEITFGLAGTKRVFFQTPDGEWSDFRDDHQGLMPETLDLRILKAKLRTAAQRDASAVGRTEKRRGALGSKPVIAGTRVPVATVQKYLSRGFTVAAILDAYPSLTEQDVEAVRHLASA